MVLIRYFVAILVVFPTKSLSPPEGSGEFTNQVAWPAILDGSGEATTNTNFGNREIGSGEIQIIQEIPIQQGSGEEPETLEKAELLPETPRGHHPML
jgi:hypothetical protein